MHAAGLLSAWAHLSAPTLLPCLCSTIGNEKFIFDSESVCIVYWAGEMTIVAYGRNEVLGVCRTEHVHPTLLSVVAQQGMVQDGRSGNVPESRTVMARLAYLIDLQV